MVQWIKNLIGVALVAVEAQVQSPALELPASDGAIKKK